MLSKYHYPEKKNIANLRYGKNLLHIYMLRKGGLIIIYDNFIGNSTKIDKF